MKLDKLGDFIICDVSRGAGRCGGRIARVDRKRALMALPGWERGDDGVYHEPPNDFGRRQRGYRARSLPRKVTGTRSGGESWLMPMFPLGPLRFRCSDCHTVLVLHREEFGLALAGEGSIITEQRLP